MSGLVLIIEGLETVSLTSCSLTHMMSAITRTSPDTAHWSWTSQSPELEPTKFYLWVSQSLVVWYSNKKGAKTVKDESHTVVISQIRWPMNSLGMFMWLSSVGGDEKEFLLKVFWEKFSYVIKHLLSTLKLGCVKTSHFELPLPSHDLGWIPQYTSRQIKMAERALSCGCCWTTESTLLLLGTRVFL
jgi:hypothetical protein